MAHILSESYQACKRSDKCSRSADIDTDKKICVIFGKLWKKNRRRNITDNLAGKNAEKESIFREQKWKKSVNFRDSCHVSGKNKEEDKR